MEKIESLHILHLVCNWMVHIFLLLAMIHWADKNEQFRAVVVAIELKLKEWEKYFEFEIEYTSFNRISRNIRRHRFNVTYKLLYLQQRCVTQNSFIAEILRLLALWNFVLFFFHT